MKNNEFSAALAIAVSILVLPVLWVSGLREAMTARSLRSFLVTVTFIVIISPAVNYAMSDESTRPTKRVFGALVAYLTLFLNFYDVYNPSPLAMVHPIYLLPFTLIFVAYILYKSFWQKNPVESL